MTTEPINLPIFIRLIEKKGQATDKLVETLRNMSQEFNVIENVKLNSINFNPTDSSENILIYSIDNELSDKEASKRMLNFLKQIWEKLFDNYPAYTEPN